MYSLLCVKHLVACPKLVPILTSADSFPELRQQHTKRLRQRLKSSAYVTQKYARCVTSVPTAHPPCSRSPPSTSTVLPLTPSISPRAQQGRKSRCIRTSNPKFPGTHFACVREQVGFGAATQATLPPAAPPARTTLGAAADTDVATQDADPCPCLRLFLAYHLPAFLPQVHLLPASALCRSIPRSWKQQEKEQAQAPHTSTSSSSPMPTPVRRSAEVRGGARDARARHGASHHSLLRLDVLVLWLPCSPDTAVAT
ncbi:hypothetical protein B0H14DRAFT_3648997 [Mycena olivaceomarginata]|nr:hypothetical protein B0H14DRAFT_3648997 [Mycena olivaceomarginata]